MLKKNEFEKLWNDHFHGIVCNHLGNTYEEYVKRENLFQNYVKTLSEIKYILIGEAPAALNQPIFNNCDGDECNTYFYNKQHILNTDYFIAPFKAFTKKKWDKLKCPIDKQIRLNELSDLGVLILDLFPFSIPITSKIRDKFNTKQIPDYFWNGIGNTYSIEARLRQYNKKIVQNVEACFISPNKIGNYLSSKIITGTLPTCGLKFDLSPEPLIKSGGPIYVCSCCGSNGFPSDKRINKAFRL